VTYPLPGDPQAAAVGFARWREQGGPAVDEQLLAALFGNSPFLTQCCLDEPAFLAEIAAQGPDSAFAAVMAALDPARLGALEEKALMAALRIARRRAALAIAIADIASAWPLESVTLALSRFADAALDAAVRHLLGAAAALGEIALADPSDPARASGVIVLGMGKLGALELNYSSDVDLILLYDEARVSYRGRRGIQHFFTRFAHDLVRLLGEHTEKGYVCRIDLRLRPDPGSTPPAVSRGAAHVYYETAGQNWERAALIKARPVAGDRDAGGAFLAELTPFLWRRHLDFAAIQDIHSIKRQIDAHGGGGAIKVLGHNVKLGRGGIREIEFFAQTQQLIWGGRMPELRVRGTCDALAALVAAGRVAPEAAGELAESYRFLRSVEHRLQMVSDAQTHTLPADAEGLRRFAIFLGYPGGEDFASDLTARLTAVEAHYARLFEGAPPLSSAGNLVFTGIEDDPDTLDTLARLGFSDPSAVSAMVRGWHHGRYRAMRSQRARELLTELIPSLLEAFGKCAAPDVALIRFDQFLGRLPAGVQLLSLFTKNPPLLGLLAEIMAAGPRVADALARRPGLLDGVLSAGFFEPLPALPELEADLGRILDRARHYEELLDRARRWAGERKFQVGVQLLRRRLDGEAAGAAFSAIAEAALASLLPRIATDFAKSHGDVPGGGLVVLGLGKLGSREMSAASDLDLILVYDAPEDVEASYGPRPLPVATYYARLTQRFVNAVTAMTQEGALYEVDMRLRPSGTQGPVATSLTAFRRYHAESAWTWEHMALTRARAVAGPAPLKAKVMAEVRQVLTRPRDPKALVRDVDDMRRRVAQEHKEPDPLDLKYRSGGMLDIEFSAQYLQLRDAHAHPQVLRENTQDALSALRDAGALPDDAARDLKAALALWRDLHGLTRLTLEAPFAAEAARAALEAVLGEEAAAALAAVPERAEAAKIWYDRLVAAPAARIREEQAK
jgi:[glutamine synthetase] adenylyltransferase / [glutamine synthetase]-adenylyl-L-tyrosine phosphorylase